MSKLKRIIVVAAVAALSLVGLAACSSGSGAAKKTVTIGIMTPTKEDTAIWNVVKDNAKKDYGITINLKEFTDYNQPNSALTSHQVDLNAFQHYAFLSAWNKAHKTDIVSIGDTWITPIHLFSDKYTSVKDLPDGATIAVPNDASNESRALFLLEGAGLIKLNVSGNTLATTSNITSNPKHLKITELDASQTAHALGSVDGSVINSNYSDAAGISLKKSIYAEPLDKNSHQWINFIGANAKDKSNKTYKDVVKSLQKSNVESEVKKQYPTGEELTAWNLKLK